jgi:integrase
VRFRSQLRRSVPSTVSLRGSIRGTCSPRHAAAGGRGRRAFDIHNFRKRHWGPAVDAAGIAKPARIYDLRSTFASNALAAGITVFELARIMGTSVGMIEGYYGALIDTAHEAILARLEATSR